MSMKFYVSAENGMVWVDDVGCKIYNFHSSSACRGPCPVHNPSYHHMRDWPIVWRQDRGIFERLCEHGVGHPDPDSMYVKMEFEAVGDDGVHGCDGCCNG
jgi:hypothetical protein